MSLRVTSSIFARARVVPRRLTRPTMSLARVGLHTRTPNHHHWKSANLKRGGGGLFRRASSIAFANPPGGAPDKQIAPSWKEEVLSSHATLGNLCFVLCAPQGPQNCGAVARVMQNFGIYDLRLVNPGPFVLLGDESDDDDTNAMYTQTVGASTEHRPDGANSVGGVNSGAKLGPDGLGFGNDLPQALRATLVDVSNASVSKGDASLTSSDDETKPKPQPQPLCAEAFRFACAADWLLRDASRHDTHLDALSDCTFVMATTARPRGNVPLVTARVAAQMLIKESKRGKVAVLFGNERTGLTNDEIAQAHACVAIPTAGQARLCRKSLKYTGASGPTSLNLSQAVGVLAYELFMAADADVVNENNGDNGNNGDDDEKNLSTDENNASSSSSLSFPKRGVASGQINIPASQLMTVSEKITLKNELVAARRALDVLALDVTTGDDGNDTDNETDETFSDVSDLDEREDKAFGRVLNAAPLQRRDAAALFQLARRVKAIGASDLMTSDETNPTNETVATEKFGPLDLKVVAVVKTLIAGAEATKKPFPSAKKTRAKVREALGLSLTEKEIQRALRRALREA